ncbi:hypothetical protein BFS14_14120 [Serratia fonticola]|nr:hypothetical protein BFS14_14120 [Serratia fonticola]
MNEANNSEAYWVCQSTKVREKCVCCQIEHIGSFFGTLLWLTTRKMRNHEEKISAFNMQLNDHDRMLSSTFIKRSHKNTTHRI